MARAAFLAAILLAVCGCSVPGASAGQASPSQSTPAAKALHIVDIAPLLGKRRSVYQKILGAPVKVERFPGPDGKLIEGDRHYKIKGIEVLVEETGGAMDMITFVLAGQMSDWPISLRRVGLSDTGAQAVDPSFTMPGQDHEIDYHNKVVVIKGIKGVPPGWLASRSSDELAFAGPTGKLGFLISPELQAYQRRGSR